MGSVRWDPYLYVGGNPVNHVDPGGEWFWTVLKVAAAGAIIGSLIDISIQVADNLLNGRDPFECFDWGSVLVSAIEGSLFGVLGGSLAKLGSLAPFRKISKATRFLLAEAIVGLPSGITWDMTVHGDTFSESLLSNMISFGFGYWLESRSWKKLDLDTARHANQLHVRPGDGSVRTERPRGDDPGISLRYRRTGNISA